MSFQFRISAAVLALACATGCFAKAAVQPAKAPVAAKQESAAAGPLVLAHNLDPASEPRLQSVVDRFNRETGGNLKLVRLEAGDKPAALNLIVRYDHSELLTQARNFLPLHEVMSKAGQSMPLADLPAEMKAGVTDARGKLVALPLVYSTPVLFYNKNAFRKAGLDPEQPPKTWFEMQGMLDKLQDAGYTCPYTSSWPVWVHIDNVSAVSGLPAVSEKGQLSFNGLPQVKHIAMMATWAKANYFKLFGGRNEASAHFHEGECAMITTNSREAVDFADAKGVDLGVAALPYHDDVYGGRRPTLADGAALWVGAGHAPAEYKQAARFVSFLLSPEMQVEVVRNYGGLPMTAAAKAAARSKLLQDGAKTIDIAFASLRGNGGKPDIRVANIDSVRTLAREELDAVWAGKKPAKAALDTSVSQGNNLLAAKPALKKSQPF